MVGGATQYRSGYCAVGSLSSHGANQKQRRSKRAKPNQVQPSTSQTKGTHNRNTGDITDDFSDEVTLDQDDADWGTSYDLRAE
jgi:hypothetical protein